MKKIFLIIILLILSFLTMPSVRGESASLNLAPSRGTFLVDNTFSISIYVDTKKSKINAIEVDLKFPSDILQITSPTAGKSFISEWLTPPTYSNVGGFINFKGGIPEGIVTSAGLVSTITFRARSPGIARIEFLDSSKVLLADGEGTPVFTNNFGGIYEILVPPPEGPKISSPTHPDSDKWYSDSNPAFSWEEEEKVNDFSYSFSQNPQEVPDIISEGNETFKSYENVQDGTWYFHLRAKKNDVWGKASHFAVKIDKTPPQEFKPKVDTSSGFIYFETKDFHSGIDHYEISVLNITENPEAAPFFIEAISPFKIYKKPGEYSVVLLAYDKAGNCQTAKSEFQILSSIFSVEKGGGVRVRGIFFSNLSLLIVSFIFIFGLGVLIFFVLRRQKRFRKGIKEIREALKEIKKIEKEEMEIGELKKEYEKEKEELEEKLQ